MCMCVCVHVHMYVCGEGRGALVPLLLGVPFLMFLKTATWQAKAVYIIKLPCSQAQEKEHIVFCLSLLYSFV